MNTIKYIRLLPISMKTHLKRNGKYKLYTKELNYCNDLIEGRHFAEITPIAHNKWQLKLIDKKCKHKDLEKIYNEMELVNLMEVLNMTRKIRPHDYKNNIYVKWE